MKNLLISILLFSILVGCSIKHNIYVDGMPISDHEYTAETPEKIRVSFLLARYYEKHFDDESMIYPEYLDLFGEENIINIGETKSLILHIKIVNLEQKPIIVWWKFKNNLKSHYHILYNGKLPRKDLSMQLPIAIPGKHTFDVVFTADKEELFEVWGEYYNERGSE